MVKQKKGGRHMNDSLQMLWCKKCVEVVTHDGIRKPKCQACGTARTVTNGNPDSPKQKQRETLKRQSYGNNDLRTGAIHIDARIFG